MFHRCILVSAFVLVYVRFGDACHTGWSSLGSMCYKASIDREDWTGAKTMCEIFGGSLAEIHNADVQAFVLGLTKSDHKTAGYWIGLTDAENEGTWKWVANKSTLSAEDYTHWGSGEPDNSHHDQNCVSLNTHRYGHWFDGHCDLAKDYICQMDSGTGSSIIG